MRLIFLLRRACGWRRTSRASVAVMAALLMPSMLGAAALATDASMWFLEQHRLQIAADAAAYAAALELSSSSMQSASPTSYTTVATNEVTAVTGGHLIGTLGTPVVNVAANFASVTVTLTSTADTFFVHAVRLGNISMQASATAGLVPSAACVLAMNPSAANAIEAGGTNGAGSITATNCGVFSDSTSSTSISVNSASITAQSVGTAGSVYMSNSGSNHVSPTPSTHASPVADPDAGMTVPTHGACTYTNGSFTAWQATPYAFASGTVFCGNTTIGGNGSSDTFAPGIYYVTGNITFNNADVTSASGVTFVLTGTTASADAGSLTWQNNSAATLTAPTTNANGGIPGILIWQTCPSPNASGAYSQVNGGILLNNGSPVTASGTIYAPCGNVELENNAKLQNATGASLSVVASTIYVTQSAALVTNAVNTAGGGRIVSLLQ